MFCNWVFIGLVSFIIFIFFLLLTFELNLCLYVDGDFLLLLLFRLHSPLFFLHSLIQFNSGTFFFREYAGIN